MTVTVGMIKSFNEVESFHTPSQGVFEIELIDGRKLSVALANHEIYSILRGLKDRGIDQANRPHFSEYTNIGERGWKICPPDPILTEIFKNVAHKD